MKVFSKLVMPLFAFAMLSLSASAQVEQAAAIADHAEISAIAVWAKADLSEAASSGDVEQIAEMNRRSDAIDAILAQAGEAIATLMQAAEDGDVDAAQAAADEIAELRKKAQDALNGQISEQTQEDVDAWKEAATNTGGGPTKAYDPVNIYTRPSSSSAQQAFYQSHYGNFFAAGRSSVDSDATPQ